MQPDLRHDFSPLWIREDRIYHVLQGFTWRSASGAELWRLRLREEIKKWCENNFGYRPELSSAVLKKGKKTWLWFANEQDRTLFQIRFGIAG